MMPTLLYELANMSNSAFSDYLEIRQKLMV
jgi:hypothetical protein